ncbi:MAG TPA: SDR family oxidoreductase, partial [Gemmatimonadaceae bacterium]|nr:SDR family oxidoreductase [Gemmatimonadaceae bacterium]
GARVVLSSRDETDLRAAVDAIRADGGRAMHVVADVGDFDEVRGIADAAIREFGAIDTWVNNAGVSIYGKIVDVPVADARRLFETNYWGVVNGSLVAIPHLREHGGALINIGSTLSDRAIPLQGHYGASKQAVKAFTDTLRMELEKDGIPISVTLVKPGAIDTPYPEHARNYMEMEPKHPPPVYAPEVVARTILTCAERPTRDVYVGAGGKMTAAMDNIPRIGDRYMKATMFDQQKMADRPRPADREDSLWEPHPDDARERGSYPGRVRKSSAYTTAAMHPMATALGLAAVGVGMALAARRAREE